VVTGLANCSPHSSYYPHFELLRQTLYLVVPAMGDTIAAGLLASAFINDDLPANGKHNRNVTSQLSSNTFT
jgi:hypothetical protein